jgi:hypothetical protein
MSNSGPQLNIRGGTDLLKGVLVLLVVRHGGSRVRCGEEEVKVWM